MVRPDGARARPRLNRADELAADPDVSATEGRSGGVPAGEAKAERRLSSSDVARISYAISHLRAGSYTDSRSAGLVLRPWTIRIRFRFVPGISA